MTGEDLRYPIGPFTAPAVVSAAQVATWIDDIAALPAVLQGVVAPLTAAQLEVPYRPGGWCSRQVIHHLADSHLNSILRFKWALTEERPTIKTYHEERWAELPDYRDYPVDAALAFLAALHGRWVVLLRGLGPAELARDFVHPDWGPVRLDATIGKYAWHGRHHLAHITRLIEREGWVRP